MKQICPPLQRQIKTLFNIVTSSKPDEIEADVTEAGDEAGADDTHVAGAAERVEKVPDSKKFDQRKTSQVL